MSSPNPSSFLVIPAIDLMDGQCVRLQQGDANRRTNYGDDPAAMARSFEDAGAKRIHIVDLDGAFRGGPQNRASIEAIRKAVSCEIEVGGGVRTRDHARALVDLGVDYFVVGTRALEAPEFIAELTSEFGDKLIVGADCRGLKLSTRGWTEDSDKDVVPFLTQLRDQAGLKTVIFTDIARDGMLNGPNMEALEAVLGIADLQIIASGGVADLADVQALRALNRPNLLGVITGKAIYDGRLSLTEALAAAN